MIVHSKTAATGSSVTADTINGYTFVCWLGCASSGWVGATYLQDMDAATTKVWFVYSAYSSGGTVLTWALYRKNSLT